MNSAKAPSGTSKFLAGAVNLVKEPRLPWRVSQWLARRELDVLYDKVETGGVITFDECGDGRWPGATKAIDGFFADKPERIQPHPACDWKYHVVKL